MTFKRQPTRYGDALKIYFDNEEEYKELIDDLKRFKSVQEKYNRNTNKISCLITSLDSRYKAPEEVPEDKKGMEGYEMNYSMPTTILFNNEIFTIFPLFLDAMDIAGAETLALEELKKSILDK